MTMYDPFSQRSNAPIPEPWCAGEQLCDDDVTASLDDKSSDPGSTRCITSPVTAPIPVLLPNGQLMTTDHDMRRAHVAEREPETRTSDARVFKSPGEVIAVIGVAPNSREARAVKTAFQVDQPPVVRTVVDRNGARRLIAEMADGKVLGEVPHICFTPAGLDAFTSDASVSLVLVENVADLFRDELDGRVGVFLTAPGWASFDPVSLGERTVVVVGGNMAVIAPWYRKCDGLGLVVNFADSVDHLDDVVGVPPWETGMLPLPHTTDLFVDVDRCRIVQLSTSFTGGRAEHSTVVIANWLIVGRVVNELLSDRGVAESGETTLRLARWNAARGAPDEVEVTLPNGVLQQPDRWGEFLPSDWAVGMRLPSRPVASAVVSGQSDLHVPERRRNCAHTGWINDNGSWLYALGDGAIDAAGFRSDIGCVEPDGGWGQWGLVNDVVDVRSAITMVLEMLSVLPRAKAALVLASILRAITPSGRARTNISLTGPSGGGKSYLAYVIQSAFGSWDEGQLPFSSDVTKAGFRAIAALYRDVVIVLDDIPPAKEGLVEALGDIKRSVWNGTTDLRALRNGSAREGVSVSALVITTEEVGLGDISVQSRNVVMPIQRGTSAQVLRREVDSPETIERLNQQIHDGVTRQFLAAVVQAYAARYEELRADWPTRRDRRKAELVKAKLADRPAEILAELECALEVLGDVIPMFQDTCQELVAELREGLRPHVEQISSPRHARTAVLLDELTGAIRSGVVTAYTKDGHPATRQMLPPLLAEQFTDTEFATLLGYRLEVDFDVVTYSNARRVGRFEPGGLRLGSGDLRTALNWSEPKEREFLDGLPGYLVTCGYTPEKVRSLGGRGEKRRLTCLIPWELLLVNDGEEPSDADHSSHNEAEEVH